MAKRLNFSNESTRNVFAKKSFDEFNTLMFKTALGEENGVTKEKANEKIREIFSEVLSLGENPSRKELRRSIRRNKVAIYEVIEELIPNLLRTGWQDNPFFREFVEFKSMDLGDTNEFYVEDESILTVSEISGGNHDLKYRIRIA